MPSDKPSVFISYARDDASLAKFIAGQLEHSGVETWRGEEPEAGGDWQQELARKLEEATLFVLLITPSYLQSRWNNFELGVALARSARSKDVQILPLTFGVSSAQLPPPLRQLQILSLDKNDATHVQQAIEAALHSAVA
jgi:hypothetical protein